MASNHEATGSAKSPDRPFTALCLAEFQSHGPDIIAENLSIGDILVVGTGDPECMKYLGATATGLLVPTRYCYEDEQEKRWVRFINTQPIQPYASPTTKDEGVPRVSEPSSTALRRALNEATTEAEFLENGGRAASNPLLLWEYYQKLLADEDDDCGTKVSEDHEVDVRPFCFTGIKISLKTFSRERTCQPCKDPNRLIKRKSKDRIIIIPQGNLALKTYCILRS
ncbi:hypothetical protein CC80DRAFT_508390 [Byssothecium circinans]|uniref:Uncharacterized protein n=1 Tax=Byssothecium circinans TaxID=147558 RepID=A0A6A5TIP9_9PLEO|nr:hypothetical protein CC80DRAFT_508390 [Byssothecium circinans]